MKPYSSGLLRLFRPSVRVVAFYRGPRWWVWLRRRVRPYRYISVVEAAFMTHHPIVYKGYVNAIVFKRGDDEYKL